MSLTLVIIDLQQKIAQLDKVIAGGASRVSFDGQTIEYNIPEAVKERVRLQDRLSVMVSGQGRTRQIAVYPQSRGR